MRVILLKPTLIKFHWFLANQVGIDPVTFMRFIARFPGYLFEWRAFRKQYKGLMRFAPCLHDRNEEGGAVKSEYFWQDLTVAQKIYSATPIKHVDIGSRVDGFVAHVASFREIEVFDIRPLNANIPGVKFTQLDLMKASIFSRFSEDGYCDSLSCLHAIEHFGLGRYGDDIDPKGFRLGIAGLAALLQKGGTLYLSTPIGEKRVEFNANWVFNPRDIVECANQEGLVLQKLILISSNDGPQEVSVDSSTLERLGLLSYKLGLFIFVKQKYHN